MAGSRAPARTRAVCFGMQDSGRSLEMKPLYGVNGLVCWTEREIAAREAMQLRFADDVRAWLRDVNPAWRFDRVEAPIMIPRSLINQNSVKGECVTRVILVTSVSMLNPSNKNVSRILAVIHIVVDQLLKIANWEKKKIKKN